MFLFPSASETFGNVALEAMASGLPVIASNKGGVKHLIRNGVNGITCERQQATLYTDALISLLVNEHNLHSYRLAARQYALSQSWDDIFSALINSYDDVLDQQTMNVA